MPPTEQCVLGAENKTNIKNLEKAIDEIKEAILQMTNHYSRKPSWPVCFALIFMSSLSTSLLALIIRHLLA